MSVGSRIGTAMNVGQRAMMNSQNALHTVSHNIANKNTEGYSRQRTESFSNVPYGTGKTRIGTGARTASIQRVNNPYMEKQLGQEKSQLGFLSGQQNSLMRLEQVYNEQQVEGINHSMVKFFNSFRELSTSPESMPKRIAVKESADLMARDFNRVAEQLKDIRSDVNAQAGITVNEINSTVQELASLNGQVQKIEIGGGFANDERDRRDLLIKKLGELVDIKWTEGDDRTVTISTGSNAILLAGTDGRRLEAVPTGATDTKAEGDFDIIYHHHEYAEPLVITDRITGGRLGGMLQVRDRDVRDFQDKINGLAYEISKQVNEVHSQGYDTFNRTGNAFFDPLASAQDAAERMTIHGAVKGDVGRIAAGIDPNAPGDNRLAHQIAELQHKKTFVDGTTSLDEYYNGIVAEMGLRTEKANHLFETQQGVVTQLENLRESYSGVNVDEEVASMIEWQKQFDASARIIRTADEMLETVINLRKY